MGDSNIQTLYGLSSFYDYSQGITQQEGVTFKDKNGNQKLDDFEEIIEGRIITGGFVSVSDSYNQGNPEGEVTEGFIYNANSSNAEALSFRTSQYRSDRYLRADPSEVLNKLREAANNENWSVNLD